YGTDLYYGLYGDGTYIREGTQSTQILLALAVQFVAAGQYVFHNDGDGHYARIEDGGRLIESVSAPTFGDMFADGNGGFYVFNNGIYRLSPFAFGEHEGITQVTLDMAMTTDGYPVVS